MIDALSRRLASLNPGAAQLRAVRGALDPAAFERDGYSVDARTTQAQAWLNDVMYSSWYSRPPTTQPSVLSR